MPPRRAESKNVRISGHSERQLGQEPLAEAQFQECDDFSAHVRQFCQWVVFSDFPERQAALGVELAAA